LTTAHYHSHPDEDVQNVHVDGKLTKEKIVGFAKIDVTYALMGSY